MYAVVDTGTTNTRVYVMEGDRIAGRAYAKAGVRDTAITGSKDVLKNGITTCLKEASAQAGCEPGQLKFVFICGMLTSEIGIMEIPHVLAPAGAKELVKSSVYIDSDELNLGVPLVAVRGIKNDCGEFGLNQLNEMDFMRGEEVQVMGILNDMKIQGKCNIVFYSSHTKIVHVDDELRIEESMTTTSGQMYEAIQKETSIGKSLLPLDAEEYYYTKEQILPVIYKSVKSRGLLRTVMMPRFMEVLMESKPADRRYALQVALACDDLATLESVRKGDSQIPFVFVGPEERCELYKELFRLEEITNPVFCISQQNELDEMTVNGAQYLLSHILQKYPSLQ